MPSVMAGPVISVQRTLIVRNSQRLLAGADPEADRAFDLVEKRRPPRIAGQAT
ncbi:hypothetical protein OG909_15910 [Streptomyces sp. NBC_01754]|uniref:hypothetical protein n=1 Tax=Streptomyces sp. NBC_01754 TaxID=2975930 RepID=UPI002DD8E262|nr:hypothetical protein [Streptomyces sp. NBC_01754]WSC93647.1 hypothetical protein OG909_15910 [Streptomyces sp. NBC_01754]